MSILAGLLVLTAGCRGAYHYADRGDSCDESRPMAPPRWNLAARADSALDGARSGGLVVRLLDRDSHATIETARVDVGRARRAIAPARVADSLGEWRYEPVPSGRYDVRVRRLGYREWRGKAIVRSAYVDTLTIRIGRLPFCVQ